MDKIIYTHQNLQIELFDLSKDTEYNLLNFENNRKRVKELNNTFNTFGFKIHKKSIIHFDIFNKNYVTNAILLDFDRVSTKNVIIHHNDKDITLADFIEFQMNCNNFREYTTDYTLESLEIEDIYLEKYRHNQLEWYDKREIPVAIGNIESLINKQSINLYTIDCIITKEINNNDTTIYDLVKRDDRKMLVEIARAGYRQHNRVALQLDYNLNKK